MALAEFSADLISIIASSSMELSFFVVALCLHLAWNHLHEWSSDSMSRRGKQFPLQNHSAMAYIQQADHRKTAAAADAAQRSPGSRREESPRLKCREEVMAAIRRCTSCKDSDGAKALLDRYLANGGEVNRSMCHVVLACCAASQQLEHMESILETMRAAGSVDVGSYNILIKTHLAKDHYDRAKFLIDEMRKDGLPCNVFTYNEMIAGFARSKYPPRKRYVWRLIEQMRSEGVEPNCFTCSIILKNVHDSSPRIEVARVMELAESLTCEMDEVLMASLVEAHIRLGNVDQVRKFLQELHVGKDLKPSSCTTFGSLIKGYGFVSDAEGVWRCWKAMRSERMQLSGITISCMVEAVASNGDVVGAHMLILELLEDEATKGLIDHWIYGLVLKGYSKMKDMKSVWAVYEEMLQRGIRPTTVTFNLLIDACIRNGHAERVPSLVEEMPRYGCEPNLITYSTRIKGFCHMDDMGAALDLLRELRMHRKIKPDEAIYKTLIDCCAGKDYLEIAQCLLKEMQLESIPISSFILSRMVRMLGQKGDVDGAFKLSADITKKYRFRPTSHVCNALIEACLSNGQPQRATLLCVQMTKNHTELDADLCQRLVTALLDSGAHRQAVRLLSTLLRPPKPAVPEASTVVLDNWRSMFSFKSPADNHDFLAEVFHKLLREGQEGQELAASLAASMQAHLPNLAMPAVAKHLKT